MPTCKKEIEMGGHWIYYHPKGVNKNFRQFESKVYGLQKKIAVGHTNIFPSWDFFLIWWHLL